MDSQSRQIQSAAYVLLVLPVYPTPPRGCQIAMNLPVPVGFAAPDAAEDADAVGTEGLVAFLIGNAAVAIGGLGKIMLLMTPAP